MVHFGYFFFVKRVNVSANFSSYTKTAELTQTRPQGFSVSMPFSVVILHQWCHFFLWSTLAGHEELARGFELIRNGEIFWMNNKVLVFGAHSQSTKHVAAALRSLLIDRRKQSHVILPTVLFGVRETHHWWLLFGAAATWPKGVLAMNYVIALVLPY